MFTEHLLCVRIPLTTKVMSKPTEKIFYSSEKRRLINKNNNNM